jgi:hypothetical protein
MDSLFGNRTIGVPGQWIGVRREVGPNPAGHSMSALIKKRPRLMGLTKQTGEVNGNTPLARALLDMAVGEENDLLTPNRLVRKVRIIRIESPRRR